MFNRSYNHKDVLTRASMTIQLIDDIVLYKAQLFSTNGNILSSNEKDTTVSVVVFKGTENITQRFTDIVWSRFSANNGLYQEDLKWGEQHKGKTTINITRDDINEKANIQVAVYDEVSGERRLVASDFISFVDINDIKGSNTPPENPKDGDLWLNTNSFPPKLMVWNSQLGEWVELIVAGEEKRNLLRNSNFYASNFNYWTNAGSPSTSIEKMSGKKWARIRSNTANNSYCGISQTIDAKSSTKYAFQMLSKIYAHSANPNCKAVAAFYSIDSNNKKTLIQEKSIDITLNAATHTTTFTSLTNTKKIEVVVSGQKQAVFDFVTTNLKLEANSIPTAWEIAIEDMEDALNQKVNNSPEEIFNSLTDGGNMQGIYVDIDENGKKNYYFNASYIKSGYISGQYINAKNLTVTKNDGSETFKIDSNGNVTIKGNIQIQGFDGGFKDAASVEDITYTVVLTNENHSIMCNANGTPISGQIGSSGKAKTKVLAYKGNRLLQAVDTTSQLADGKFCVNIKSTDGTGTLRRVPGSYDEYYIDGTVSDNGYFDLEIVFEKTSNAKAIKRFTYAKIKPGATGPQGPQGVPGPQGLQGLPGTSGTDGKTTYFHIKYSAVSNPTNSSQMTDTPNTYIGTYVDYTATSSTDPKKYTWARFQGIQGSKGEQGIPGTNGANGKTTYLHIKYSNDGGKTFTGNNGEDVGSWIGQYTDFNINDSTSVSAYKWSKIQGATGAQGPAGPQGIPGPQGEALDIYDGTFSEGTKFWSLSYANYTKPNTNTQTKTANTSIYGGKTLKITNDTWLYSKNSIPIEEGRVYKFIFRVRQLQNPTNDVSKNRVYAGATEFAHDGTKLSGNNGTYFVASNIALPVKWNSVSGDSAPATYNSSKDDQYVWTEYTKYMSTTPKAAIKYANIVKFPAVNAFNSRTKYIKPMFIVNYSGGNGIAEVDSLIVKDVTSEYEAAKESANKLNNNAQEVWDKVTQEGKTQGLFVAQNGKVYINGEYINAKNLRVQDKDNNLTLGVDDNGNVTIRATSLSIGSKTVASKDDISTSIGDIQIGGRNFVLNTSFEKMGNTILPMGSLSFTVAPFINKKDLNGLNNSIEWKAANFTQNQWLGIGIDTSLDDTTIAKGETFTISFWYYVFSDTPCDAFTVCFKNHAANKETLRKSLDVAIKDKWVRCEYTAVTSENIALSNRTFYAYLARNGHVKISKVKVEKGTKATDWTPAPEDINKEISNVSSSLGSLESSIKNAFGDGIINDSEARALASNIQILNNEKTNIDKEHSTIYANGNLAGSAKTNLNTAKTEYDNAHTSLISSINTAIANKRVTDAARNTINNCFTTYRTKLSILRQRLQEANDYISTNKVNSVQVGGRNLTPNTGFYNNLAWWNMYNDATNLTIVHGRFGEETKAAQVTLANKNGSGILTPYCYCIGGNKYVVSCWVKVSKACRVGQLLKFVNAANQESNPISAEFKNVSANTWTYIEQKFTAPSTAVKFASTPRIESAIGADATLAVTEFKAEDGTKATAWSPSPEDIDEGKISIGGSIADINSSEGQIQYPKLDVSGMIRFTDFDKDLAKHYVAKRNNKGEVIETTINGASIETGSVTADQMTMYNLSVVRRRKRPHNSTIDKDCTLTGDHVHWENIDTSFNIDEEGSVKASGTFSSFNFNNITKDEGWQINEDGDSVFNNTIIRGRVELPNAGVTDHGGGDGQQLLVNTDFKKYSTKTNIGWDNALNGTILADSWSSYNGGVTNPSKGYHGHIDTETFGYPVGRFVNKNSTISAANRWMALTQNIPTSRYTFKAKTKYTFSFEVFADTKGMKIFGGLYYRKTGATSHDFHSGQFSYYTTQDDVNAKKWRKVSYTFETIKDMDTSVVPTIYIYGYGGVEGIAYIRYPKLEEGEKANNWSPESSLIPYQTRIWAGESYNNRDNAPFRVLHNGTVIATRGEFGGTFTGRVEIGNIKIHDTNETPGVIEIKNRDDVMTVVKVAENESFFSSPVFMGVPNPATGQPAASFKFNPAEKRLEVLNNGVIDVGNVTSTKLSLVNASTGAYMKLGTTVKIAGNNNNLNISAEDANKINLRIGNFKDNLTHDDATVIVDGNIEAKAIVIGPARIFESSDKSGIDFYVD